MHLSRGGARFTKLNTRKKDIRDPFGLNFWPKFKGRDGCRTPLPWNSKQKNYGFSSGSTWLPCDYKFEKLSVDIQENDKSSMLNFTREKIRERKIKLVSSTSSKI